jgi:diphosphomevalonate decarboxylase
MKKVTVKSSTDIALVKYWGKKDEVLRLPENGSVSMILDGTDTVTTVEFQPDLQADDITIQGKQISHDSREAKRVVKQLDRIRSLAQERGLLKTHDMEYGESQSAKPLFAKVVSENTFPRGTGLSSSGSGMSALTFAATKALGLEMTERELSILSRQASGTACRSSCGGFVEWKDGDTSETSYSETIFPANHWDLRSVVVVVDEGQKRISSTEGHTTAQGSKFFVARQKTIKQKIKDVKNAIAEKNFPTLGDLIERECLEFHSILLTSNPPYITWYPGTIQIMHEVQAMRREGIEAYFTINTGFNVHVITLPEYEEKVTERLEKLSLVKKILHARVGEGPKEIEEHLF